MSTQPDPRESFLRTNDTPFLQQKLPQWRPNYSSISVSVFFLTVGVFFFIGGIYVEYKMFMLDEMAIDYTDCESTSSFSKTCAELIGNSSGPTTPDCTCNIRFDLDKQFQGRKVYLYYALTNVYQNYRMFMKSKNDRQLSGIDVDTAAPLSCGPYRWSEDDKIIWPCGALPNAMFQDTFTMKNKSSGQNIPLSYEDVVWSTDMIKFQNPPDWNTDEFSKRVASPPNWKRSPWNLDPQNPENNGVENVDFIIWMRPSPSSDFRKLYRSIENGLEPGEYTLEINYSYSVKDFGRKSFILATTSPVLGGRNLYAGVLYIVGGILYFMCGLGFRYLTDENFENWLRVRVQNRFQC